MKYAFKTEIKPTPEQVHGIRRCMGICRWLYNRYITENQRLHRMYQRGLLDEHQAHFISAIDFDKYVNNRLKVQERYAFISLCGSKARKKILVNAQAALKNFFKGKSYFPRFKRHGEDSIKLYFPKNNKADWTIERHRVRVPTFGWLRLKECGYLPTAVKISSGTISCRAGRYYVSVLVDRDEKIQLKKEAVAVSIKFIGAENPEIIRLGKCLAKAEQKLARKYRLDKADSRSKQKQQAYIKRLAKRAEDICTDAANKAAAEIVRHRPRQIFFPELDSQAIDKKLYKSSFAHKYACRYLAKFKGKLTEKCLMLNIEFKLYSESEKSDLPQVIVQI